MKKKRLLLALVVVLTAGACVLPWWEEVWLAVAYEKVECLVLPLDSGSDWVEFTADAYRPRLSKLHPASTLIADQVCRPCLGQQHRQCFITYSMGDRDVFVFRGFAEDASDAHCTCPTCYPEWQ